jgi:hypothetical protein
MKERIAPITKRWRRAKRRKRSLIRNVWPIADPMELPPKRLSIETPIELLDVTMQLATLQSL